MKAFVMAAVLLAGSASVATATDFYVSVRPASPQEGYGKIEVSKAALGSNPIRLWQNTSIDPDCAPTGRVTLTVIKPPEHGQVQISTEPFFYAFPKAKPRSACNDKKVMGNRAFYTAASGYIGPDHVVLQGSSSEGIVRRIAIDIDVRQDR
jgi:hypothetical protein